MGCSDDGCSLTTNAVSLHNLTRPDEIHAWHLTISDGQSLTVLLTGLTVDYDPHVLGPDGTLVGQDETHGTVDRVVELTSLPGGTYVVYVNSPRGEVSDQPYALAVLPMASGLSSPGD